jgi:ATP:ADP antiporter, AAA family
LTRSDAASPRHEIAAVVAAFLLFFLVFASYFMLRPIRETFGIVGGVKHLQWLFTGTFVTTLCVVPLYGWLSKKLPRSVLLPLSYVFVSVVTAGIAAGLFIDPKNVWLARAFYIWLSVMNLFVISIAWSLMADVFNAEQGHRLFGRIAAGASLGGVVGPLLTNRLVDVIGHAGLLVLSTVLLLAALIFVRYLLLWRDRYGTPLDQRPPAQPIGGSIWAGVTTILRSPYLLSISLFILLLTSVSTFVYFEQARVVDASIPNAVDQTRLFSGIDTGVQALSLVIQLFLTGEIARRLGVITLLVSVPLAMIAGFLLLAAMPALTIVVAVMMLRRVGEYALIRPGREMLFTTVDAETKYKAKNAIDTVVYRGGDAVSAWLDAGLAALGSSMLAAFGGALLAGLWAWSGWFIGKRHDAEAGQKAPAVPAAA